MSNPFLKKNPFMSLWLSGAHSVANAARGHATAAAKRQSRAAVTKAGNDVFSIWAQALAGGSARKKRTRR